ncbi:MULTISPECIES: hypothetical protein [Methanosphaera]|uniref:Uncharacterized protein n=2 Tax=Methanosphaera stadtmanae TaxID=2317 RepID=Q2NFL6_METST|nr:MULTISPECIES: hypothetical protein [Methanosphaera]ABC57387.1 hypothetical protein Msp_0999 [Methanosphaera stadtmanae DSM 3091]OEC90949.1 hypothetical protein A9758_07175 [Methanosphaera sp. A6]RAP02929.1 hypothetical protein CA615_04950 [Methanosphaera stadtmanae]RAP47070.1 MAG: hypothetical protein BZ132_04745 [Methanosphaera sp. DEW79]
MLTEKNIKKYASTVLLNTVDNLFDNKETLINNFYKDFVESNKRNKKLKSNIKDNEVVDEYLLEELEKSFTQNDIGRVLQKEMVKANDNAIADLANVLDEKLLPVSRDLKNVFNDDVKYNQFRKYVTENLVVSNLNLNTSTIKALKTMNISGIQAAQIIQLISQVDN